jgi:hypothetical protein
MAKAFPLRLPKPLRDSVERLAKAHGMSTNEFLMRAVAERFGYDLSAPATASRQEPLPLMDDPSAYADGQKTAAAA